MLGGNMFKAGDIVNVKEPLMWFNNGRKIPRDHTFTVIRLIDKYLCVIDREIDVYDIDNRMYSALMRSYGIEPGQDIVNMDTLQLNVKETRKKKLGKIYL